MGKIPHIYRDHDYAMGASVDPAAIAAAEAAKTEAAALRKQVDDMKTSLDAANTKITDLTAAARQTVAPPARKTTPAADVTRLLSRYSLSAQMDAEGNIDMNAIGTALKAAGIDPTKRIEIKREIERVMQDGTAA